MIYGVGYRFFTCVLLGFGLQLCATVNAATLNVIYINGINTTRSEALIDRNELRSRLTNSTNYAGPAKRTFSVSLVHNPIGWFNVDDDDASSQDKKELFLLKTSEECFASDFQKIVVPHNESRAIDRAAASRVNAYLNNIIPGSKGGHTCGANSLSDPNNGIGAPDMAMTKQTAIDLASKILSYPRSVVVAHSQGNLLAHLAYARIASDIGEDTTRRVRIVNVANTSAFSANALDMTHSGDLALRPGLILLGQLNRRTTPRCADERCNFLLSEATLDAVLVDGKNHSFVDFYLSTLPISVRNLQGVSFTVGADKFQDRFVDFVYAAAKSLDIVGGETLTSVVYAKTQTDENIQYGVVTDFYAYYFLGYESLANPPAQPNYWIVTREFDAVRVKKTGGTASCSQIGGNSTLFDNTGNSVASLVRGYPDGDYCVFTTDRGGAYAAAIPVGTRIAGISISPTRDSGAFTLAGSSQNGGRSVNGYNTADRAGGFAFQFCLGACDRPF